MGGDNLLGLSRGQARYPGLRLSCEAKQEQGLKGETGVDTGLPELGMKDIDRCHSREGLTQPPRLPILPRPASGVTLSTWNTCSSMGLSPEPRMPQGTRPCTSVPSTIRSAQPSA